MSTESRNAAAPGPVTDALPRCETSKTPTRSRTARVLGDDAAAGVLQRHRPAAEVAELGAEREVPVVQRGQQGWAGSLMGENLPAAA